MIKRISIILLMACFLSFTVAPYPALAEEEEASADARLLALGLIFVAGAIWISGENNHASKDKDTKFANKEPELLPQISNKEEKGFDIGLSFANAGYSPDAYGEPFMEPKDEWRSPELKVGFTW